MLASGWRCRKDSARQPARVIRLVQINQDALPAEPVGEVTPLSREVLAANASMYRRSGFDPPWVAYLVVDKQRCVGTCAFKGAPRENRVEIAYFTFPEYEGQGLATQMAEALLNIARAQIPGIIVAAQTLPTENASTHILAKLGFTRVGTAEDDEVGLVWEWHLE
jgi:[ribosomal protein S5]-alanine N-acetyltransferase